MAWVLFGFAGFVAVFVLVGEVRKYRDKGLREDFAREMANIKRRELYRAEGCNEYPHVHKDGTYEFIAI